MAMHTEYESYDYDDPDEYDRDHDRDRRNRFFPDSTSSTGGGGGGGPRAASQPPHSAGSFISSPPATHLIPSSLGGGGAWGGGGLLASQGRSASYRFASTFEDDELVDPDDELYDARYNHSSSNNTSSNNSNYRGRTYAADLSRSRSQSLATAATAAPVGSGRTSAAASYTQGFSIPGTRFEAPGSRYGSLGALSHSHSYSHGGHGNAGSPLAQDASNMSPFVRDVGQLVLDDGSFRELWERERGTGGAGARGGPGASHASSYAGAGASHASSYAGAGASHANSYAGAGAGYTDDGGGGSGSTSRRHSVSVVQPRRLTAGFNAPDASPSSSSSQAAEAFSPFGAGIGGGRGGGGGLLLSDDDLGLGLGLGALSLSPSASASSSAARGYRETQREPGSLPIYAPLGRTPPAREYFSPPKAGEREREREREREKEKEREWAEAAAEAYFSGPPPAQAPAPAPRIDTRVGGGAGGGAGEAYPQYEGAGGGYRPRAPSASGGGPLSPRGFYPYQGGAGQQQQQGHGQHPSHLSSPIHGPSHPHAHALAPQQHPAQQPQQQQQQHAELGKGLPLHAVPADWPLFIVEFKAGRTDLFYRADERDRIRVGDLVIVEADRGKDLGKVVNDSITLGEVEAFWAGQARFGSGQSPPTSPGGADGAPPGKKEIAPKMIYGKAGAGDAQLLVAKMQDEQKALALCQTKVRAKKLPMEVVDAEYQWDRRKLTFYFVAEKRIDFRELVRELFRLYKTRIWMASLQGAGAYDQ
ncbi:PSP1-domain-containing protein [Mycena vulgaris]|nr:PSP1-domain-containing protein [Mycena vulgaris]